MLPTRSLRRSFAPAVWLERIVTGVPISRRKAATAAAALLAISVGYHVVFGRNGLTVYEQKKQTERALAQQLQALRQENDGLKGHVELLETDPDAIEHQAREELHYTRPGEVIYTLPPEPASASH